LKGNEGVIIPKLNVNDLMLKNEIVEAVKNKKFSIYAIENIDEAIEILTGIKAGKIGRDNMYERGTFYSIVEKKLKKITKLLEEKNDNKSKK